MKDSYRLFLDIPLVQTLPDGGRAMCLRLEYAENAKGFGYQANLYEGDRLVLSSGLRLMEALFFWVFLAHVSRGAIALPDGCAAVAGLDLHRTKLQARLYDAKGGTDFAFFAWCDAGALFLGWGWGGNDLPIASVRLDEAGLAALARLAQDMGE